MKPHRCRAPRRISIVVSAAEPRAMRRMHRRLACLPDWTRWRRGSQRTRTCLEPVRPGTPDVLEAHRVHSETFTRRYRMRATVQGHTCMSSHLLGASMFLPKVAVVAG